MPAAGPAARTRAFLPFILVALAGLASAAVPSRPERPGEWLAAIGLTLLTIPLARSAWIRDREALAVLPAAVFLVGVAFLRDSVGGSNGGTGVLVLLPVIWVALHGSRRQLWLTMAAVAATWAYPLIAIGGERYPATGWRAFVLLLLLAYVLGDAVQRLVTRIRREAAERAELASRLERLAGTDHLTALPNRRSWTHRIENAMELADLRDEPLAVALLDLDGLKAVNDTEGHEAGDRLLKGIAAAWSAGLEGEELLARLGGDEFALALPGRTAAEAVARVDALRAAAARLGAASAGVAQYLPGEHRAVLLARADAALYVAKRGGGDATVASPSSPPTRAVPAAPTPA
jgi:diguanylate cyclase (GGDEF)-like protein